MLSLLYTLQGDHSDKIPVMCLFGKMELWAVPFFENRWGA